MLRDGSVKEEARGCLWRAIYVPLLPRLHMKSDGKEAREGRRDSSPPPINKLRCCGYKWSCVRFTGNRHRQNLLR